jgi:hypothetical protein
VIAFNARYLADALEIGSTLCLSDEMSPAICRHPTGRFCVIMPMRVTIPAGTNAETKDSPQYHVQAAAWSTPRRVARMGCAAGASF